MDWQKYQNSLLLLNNILHTFSLTKNISQEQWNVVRHEFLQIVVNDIAQLFEFKPLVQIANTSTLKALASSQELNTDIIDRNNISSHTSEFTVFELDNKEVLFIKYPFLKFTEEEKTLLNTIVNHVKTVYEWRENIHVQNEQQKRLKLLHQITVSIRASLDLGEVLAKTARDLGKSLDVSRCFIRRQDPNNMTRILATEQEYNQDNIIKAADIIFDFETEWIKNVFANIHSNPKPLYIKNTQRIKDESGLAQILAQEIELKTFLAVPLIHDNNILGYLCFHQCDREREFTKSELQFIYAVAEEASNAIVQASMYKNIQLEAKTDDLTGLYNKASFHEQLNKELERAERNNGHVSLMMIDLDYLKRANDTYGHMVGDEMIQLLGLKLKQNLRQIDIIARFGGDEFGVILPNTPLENAKQFVTRLIEQILQSKHPIAGNLSLSAGVAGTPHTAINKELLIEEADKALYLAKELGKGQVCFADNPLMKRANEASN